MNRDPVEFLCSFVVLFFAIGIHEFAHCKFADLAGDPTPSYYGRVTLNLFKHFEPTGTIMIVLSSLMGFGIGWGKPAPMDPRKMRNPRWDFFIAVAAGPLSNACQAFLYSAVFRVLVGRQGFDQTNQLQVFLWLGIIINISLVLFNLIPFGPLDGHYLLGLLMPEKPRYHWFLLNQRIGMPGLFAAVILLQVFHADFLMEPIFKIAGLLIGQPIQ